MEEKLPQYQSKFLINHLKDAGYTNTEIEEKLKSLPNGEDKEYLIQKFLDTLPVEEREAAAERLGHSS